MEDTLILLHGTLCVVAVRSSGSCLASDCWNECLDNKAENVTKQRRKLQKGILNLQKISKCQSKIKYINGRTFGMLSDMVSVQKSVVEMIRRRGQVD